MTKNQPKTQMRNLAGQADSQPRINALFTRPTRLTRFIRLRVPAILQPR